VESAIGSDWIGSDVWQYPSESNRQINKPILRGYTKETRNNLKILELGQNDSETTSY